MFRILKVTGNSLTPKFYPGDYVLIATHPRSRKNIQQGDVVVFEHPVYGVMIKEVTHIDPATGQLHVRGTHPNSVDSARFGPISIDILIGKVRWHFSKPQR